MKPSSKTFRVAFSSSSLAAAGGAAAAGASAASSADGGGTKAKKKRAEGEPGDDDEDLEVILMSPSELDSRLASGDEWLDGKSVTAWFRAKQLLGL